MQRSMLGRFLPGYIAIVSVALIATIVATGSQLNRIVIHRENQATLSIAEIVAAAIAKVPVSERSDLLNTISSLGGNPVAVLVAPPGVTRDGHTEAPQLLEAYGGPLPVSSLVRASGRRTSFAAVEVEDNLAPPSIIYVSRQLPLRDEAVTRVIILMIAGSVILMAGIYFFLRRYALIVNQPVERIRSAARRYADGELEFQWDPTGPPEIQGLARDLHQMAHEMRERLMAISAQRNQLETILSSMVEGVLVLDDSRHIVSMNAAAGALLGVDPAEGAGKTLLQYVRIAELDTIADAARTSLEPVERTVTLYRNHALHLQVHATKMGDESEGSPGGVLLVMNNISRIKELEKVRSDFVANVSHELKTPVTSIKGFVETLLDESDLSSEQASRFLGIILKHTNRLNSILEDLLSLSRIEQTDQQIDIMPCSSISIIDAAVDVCRAKATAKGIQISREVSGPSSIQGNPSLLEQALVNLIDNAIKYSDTGKSVSVRARNQGDRLVFSVEDEGQGIRRQELSRVFERFYRTDKARSRELGGTGLGLAIVKHIALLHDGEVGVESTVGAGSTFIVSIPQPSSEIR